MIGRYFDPTAETMARGEIAALQEAMLLEQLPYVYERSPLMREAWEDAGVHPKDVRSLEDFRERAPFLDKDAIRAYRDRHADPFGGTLCVSPEDLVGIFSTSGTTGDPTLVPEGPAGSYDGLLERDFWEAGLRAGDFVSLALFTFRGRRLQRALRRMDAVPVFFDHHPDEVVRLAEVSLALRPALLYSLSGALVTALEGVAGRVDLRDAFSSYRGAVFAGEPLGARARAAITSWGLELFVHTSVGDVGAATECRAHDGCHFWEDAVLVENLSPGGAAPVSDGERGELVVTALADRVAPLVRYRSGDLVRLTREPCECGRTHGRLWTLGRTGDEVVVRGRSILPIDIWPAIEAVEETSAALFQVIASPQPSERLRLRVGYADARSLERVRERVKESVMRAVGVEAEVELVPNQDLLRLGPPHKIPRVARA